MLQMPYDFLVIGAGISGAAAAFELAAHGTVLLLEAESSPGYHSTGRSAALFTPHFGSATVQAINLSSRDFFLSPPEGFCDGPLVTPRGLLTIATPGMEDALVGTLALSAPGSEVVPISIAEALAMAPLLRPERVAAAAYEPGVMDIDVALLHQSYLRGFKQRSGTLVCGKRLNALTRTNGHWKAEAGGDLYNAKTIINAAGAWAEIVGQMAGTKPIGLVPKRRTAIVVDAPNGIDVKSMPAVDFAGADAYFKPDAGRIMASPGDQTPMEPQDIQPDEWDMAVVADWLQTETIIQIRRIGTSWAGLRSFVENQNPVVGFDADVQGFFWLAAQGGYGIMMAPALAKAVTELIIAGTRPLQLAGLDLGLKASGLSPQYPTDGAQ
jgi:D-arginine dehydrogenase